MTNKENKKDLRTLITREYSNTESEEESYNLIKNILDFITIYEKNSNTKNELSIGLYWSTKREIDTKPIIENLLSNNFRKEIGKNIQICLPKIYKNTTDSVANIMFHRVDGSSVEEINSNLEESAFYKNIYEPRKENQVTPDIVITPAVAFDKHLNRLGRGGGFYDRYISSSRKRSREDKEKQTIFIGICLERNILESIPTDKWDAKVDYLISDKNTRSK